MIETIGTIVLIVALLVGLPWGILWLRDRLKDESRRRPSRLERIASDRRAYEERLLRPDWEFYERHLQRPAPPGLRDLYADRELVTAEGLEYSEDERISSFDPLDERGYLDTRRWLGFEAIAIATNAFGDSIYLRPGASEADAVYITHHDGGDTEVFAGSVASMLERLRQAKRSA